MTLHLILIDPITEMSSYSRFLFHFLARFMSRFESDLAVSVIFFLFQARMSHTNIGTSEMEHICYPWVCRLCVENTVTIHIANMLSIRNSSI